MTSSPRSPAGVRRRLRAVEDPPPLRHRPTRARRSRSFGNPLWRGALALSAASISSALGIWLLVSGGRGAAAVLALAAVFAAVYVALVAQAFKRGKVVEYWEDRRELRWELSRQEAYARLLLETLDRAHRLRDRSQGTPDVKPAFQAMVDATYSVFAPAHDDLAVLLAYQAGEDCQVVCSKLGPGSRWHDLRSGKRCNLKGNLEQRLTELAPCHYSKPIATYFEPVGSYEQQSITSWQGTLWLITLQDSELASEEKDLLEPLLPHLSLIADHWSPALLETEPGRLHAIG